MLITPERKVPQRSAASQNDHKSKAAFEIDFQKSDFPALIRTEKFDFSWYYFEGLLIKQNKKKQLRFIS